MAERPNLATGEAAVPGGAPGDRALALALAVGLVSLTLLVYASVGEFGFLRYDDDDYVYANAHVLRGLSAQGLGWAFTTFHASNWHPLTWLSHMADVQLFGADPGWHHRMNVAWHALNALLLFGWLRAATRATWRSALVAALFAVHPLHVESVAWISERKDVLSTFFFLAGIFLYVAYVRRPGLARYGAVALAMALGLMAKPMVVTFPAVLLMLDIWPLRRLPPGGAWRPGTGALVREKIPLLALSAVSAVVTLAAQAQGGSVQGLVELPLGARLANAMVSYAAYLRSAIWPAALSAHYPHPAGHSGIPLVSLVAAALLVAGATALAWSQRGRRPWVAVGWAWYVVTLLPVIGIVQVGGQAMADRYTYVPLVGPFVAVAWTLPALPPMARRISAAAAATAVLLLAVVARAQVATWRDDVTLFRHALSVTGPNPSAQYSLANGLWAGAREAASGGGPPEVALAAAAEAEWLYRQALAARPAFAEARFNLANLLALTGRSVEALWHYEEAARLKPREPRIRNNLGIALGQQGRLPEAADQFREALRLDPGYEDARRNLGAATRAMQGPAPPR